MNVLLRVFVATTLSAMLFACTGERPQFIDNPAWDAKTSGIYSIERVEHTGEETLVTVKTSFLPNWWVDFTTETYLEIPDTGERLYVVSMDKGELNTRIVMPASGDSVFVLHFPPLDRSVSKVDMGEGESSYIFGISMYEQEKPETKTRVPAKVRRWLNKELRASEKKTVWNLSPDTFFEDGTARVVGYIKGYDPRLGFTTAIVYCGNEITREDFPKVVEIRPDGRFEVDVPLLHPTQQAITFSFRYLRLPVYLEPGQTLGLVIDWQDFLHADRYRDRRGEFRLTEYMGPAAQVNKELAAYKEVHIEWNEFDRMYKEMQPAEYKTFALEKWDNDIADLERYDEENGLLPESKALLRAYIDGVNSEYMYNYPMYRRHETTEASQVPVPDDFYDFMPRLNMDNPAMLVSRSAESFINRFEYSSPFSRLHKPVGVDIKSLEDYLTEDAGVDPADEALVAYLDFNQKAGEIAGRGNLTYEEMISLFSGAERVAVENALKEKFIKEYDAYEKIKQEAWDKVNLKEMVEMLSRKDSVLTAFFNMKPSLITQIIDARTVSHIFNFYSKEVCAEYLSVLKERITNAFIMSQVESYYDEKFVDNGPKVLPDNTAGRVFSQIIEPFRGKILVVDFWGVFCGPCVYGIEHSVDLRKELEDSPDIEFLFITSEEDSPLDRYDEMVTKNGMTNTFRLSNDDYLYLRELFRFNGIPRYVLIDREGRVIDDNAHAPYSRAEVERLIEKVDKPAE